MIRRFDLVLIGFGRVARRFVTLLEEQRDALAGSWKIAPRVVAIATGHHGRIVEPRGLDAPALAVRIDGGGMLPGGSAPAREPGKMATAGFLRRLLDDGPLARTARAGRLVVVETTTLDVADGRPAIDHVRTALVGGAHVVTANKGPAAFAYRPLAALAGRAGRRFLFEGAVMDGVPIFNLVRETLPTVRVTGFRGVVNATTNYILTALERGESFADALGAMQAEGTAEADPSLDIDGWDAAAKASVMANVFLEGRITPREVEREGIGEQTMARVRAAGRAGRRLKLVAGGERVPNGRVRATVRLEELPATDLLAGLDAQQNALVLQTDLLGEIAIVQRGAGLTQTAYALLSDLVAVSAGPTGARRR